MPVGQPKRNWSLCCKAGLIIVPAYPVRDRVVRCCNCGKENTQGYKHAEPKRNYFSK